ncbi:MAG: hypothetical protein PHQ78_03620, partial [Candidatus Cloacimonetes bacterium]|nr:hypothetical protein [Candidatus Cloacimonadota bacterium]
QIKTSSTSFLKSKIDGSELDKLQKTYIFTILGLSIDVKQKDRTTHADNTKLNKITKRCGKISTHYIYSGQCAFLCLQLIAS